MPLSPSRSHPQLSHIIWIAGALAVALTIGVLISIYRTDLDSDGDGLTDAEERQGWQTVSGTIFVTDPHRRDTDGDGLTDGEEAGAQSSSKRGEKLYEGLADPTARDTDADMLDDRQEMVGWLGSTGDRYRTDPKAADSDGDGLLDGWEAGEAQHRGGAYTVHSDPLRPDSDDDGLSDADEADLSLDPFLSDTDGDGIPDYTEVNVLGTASELADTDGDGLDDGYEAAEQGMDPLRAEVEMDPDAYAREFMTGMLAGDAAPDDSIAWLAGNLASGAVSTVPVVGWAIGGVADLRDVIASSIRADWASAAYSAIGLVPNVGDSIAFPLKITRFLTKHPHLVDEVCSLIARVEWISEGTRVKALAAAAPGAWGTLSEKTSTTVLTELAHRGISLKKLASAMARVNHVDGVPAPFLPDVSSAERKLIKIVSDASPDGFTNALLLPTAACDTGCASPARLIDVLADGTAHEAKLGYVTLTPAVSRQILADAYLIDSGQIEGAHWHFFASSTSNSVGASTDVLNLLTELNISYSIHLPE